MSRMNYGKRFNSSTVSVRRPNVSLMGQFVPPCFAFASDESRAKGRAKAAATMRNRKNGITLAHKDKKTPAVDEYFAAEARMKARITEAVNLICFAVEEMSNCPPPKTAQRSFATVDQGALIHTIRYLCDKAKIKMPELACERKPGQRSTAKNHCINCGAEITQGEAQASGTCADCFDHARLLHQASERRRDAEREQERLKRIAKQLTKTIGKVERGLKNVDNS